MAHNKSFSWSPKPSSSASGLCYRAVCKTQGNDVLLGLVSSSESVSDSWDKDTVADISSISTNSFRNIERLSCKCVVVLFLLTRNKIVYIWTSKLGAIWACAEIISVTYYESQNLMLSSEYSYSICLKTYHELYFRALNFALIRSDLHVSGQ